MPEEEQGIDSERTYGCFRPAPVESGASTTSLYRKTLKNYHGVMRKQGLIDFPPYGALARPYAEQINHPRSPGDFPEPGSWESFVDECVDEVAALLWPRWNYASASWIDPNLDAMLALTTADFAIFAELGYSPSPLEAPVNSSEAVAWIGSHKPFFEEEDGAGMGSRAALYSSSMPHALAHEFSLRMDEARRAKVGTASMQVKHQLQRPRAYQVAALLGISDFQWTTGATSMSPSMSSGHCLQGLLMTIGAVDLAIAQGHSFDAGTLEGLEQFAADVGDRRVYAGIHYPSDNIASWMLAALIGDRVLSSEQSRASLRSAVLNRSEVWKRLKTASTEHLVLKAPISRVEELLGQLV